MAMAMSRQNQFVAAFYNQPSVYIPHCLLMCRNKPLATPGRSVKNEQLQLSGVCAVLPLRTSAVT